MVKLPFKHMVRPLGFATTVSMLRKPLPGIVLLALVQYTSAFLSSPALRRLSTRSEVFRSFFLGLDYLDSCVICS
jgi:hypothetical protein